MASSAVDTEWLNMATVRGMVSTTVGTASGRAAMLRSMTIPLAVVTAQGVREVWRDRDF